MSNEITWSPEQEAFITWARDGEGSCILEAVAGAGKSTTLVEAARVMPGQVALCAFNKSAGEDLKAKLANAGVDWKKAQAGTVHSFCFSAYRKLRPDVRVEGDKVRQMIAGAISPMDVLAPYTSDMQKLISLAKQQAFGIATPTTDDVDAWLSMAAHFDVFDDETPDALRRQVVVQSIAFFQQSVLELDVIDFDDMIYLPLKLRARFWQFDVVMVDEAQDTNPARRAAIRAMVKFGGRVIAVGDKHQAIYGFTGADSDALDLIASDFDAIRLPLTTTYRCPKAVVAFSHKWVKHIHAADTAPQGVVSQMKYEDFFKQTGLDSHTAILCRNTKPIVAMAMALVRRKIPCRIEGRDVSNKIVKTMKRWKVRNLDALVAKLDGFLEHETTRLLAKKQETKLAEVADLVETCKVIIDQCREDGRHSIAQVVEYTESLFGDSVKNLLVLSTIHKAKGREWRRVFWLDRANTCPSKWARQAWQKEQEKNLCYVAATRAMHELVDLDGPPLPRK